uniref:B30.2/SPRY domain-containing protein n=1 Tax=Oryzias latipes TaxID=8090 RepID=A0A3P9JLD8_ORYLA
MFGSKCFSFYHICLIISLVLITFSMQKKAEPSEPKTKKDFLKYSELTLDLNTAHPHLELSAANRKATFTVNTGGYHSHPDRFTSWIQVLSRESLSRRHYWEVKWTGGAIYVAVAYKNVGTSQFGSDDKSWALYCDKNSYIFYHKDVQTRLPGPGSSRVGVYLDHGAGVLAFYKRRINTFKGRFSSLKSTFVLVQNVLLRSEHLCRISMTSEVLVAHKPTRLPPSFLPASSKETRC